MRERCRLSPMSLHARASAVMTSNEDHGFQADSRTENIPCLIRKLCSRTFMQRQRRGRCLPVQVTLGCVLCKACGDRNDW